jgi:hypothetical protein
MKFFKVELSNKNLTETYIGKSLDLSYAIKGNEPWVRWGPNNDLPYWLCDISQVNYHRQLLDYKTTLTRGANFLYNEDSYPALTEYINETDAYKVFASASRDQVTFCGHALQIIWDKKGKSIAKVEHLSLPTLRIENPSYFDRATPENVYVCTDWRQYKKKGFEPVQVPLFNPEKAKEQPLQILYHYEYYPGNCFYPIEDYRPVLTYLQVERGVGNTHLNLVKNNLITPGVLTINEVLDEEERLALKRDFKSQHTGEDNAGEVLVFYSESGNPPTFVPLNTGNNAEIYDTLDKITVQKIISAHKLSSPALAGLPGGGSIFNSELSIAFEYFTNTVIRDYQLPLLSSFSKIFMINQLMDKRDDLQIESLNAIQFKFSENVLLATLSKNELRAELGYGPRNDGDTIGNAPVQTQTPPPTTPNNDITPIQ